MDFSKVGLKEGLLKVLNVAVYIIVSMVVVGLGMWVANQAITWREILIASSVGGANLLLVFLQKWLSTQNEPIE
jgi:hypothetical protein